MHIVIIWVVDFKHMRHFTNLPVRTTVLTLVGLQGTGWRMLAPRYLNQTGDAPRYLATDTIHTPCDVSLF